jgi:hypothetical protein
VLLLIVELLTIMAASWPTPTFDAIIRVECGPHIFVFAIPFEQLSK